MNKNRPLPPKPIPADSFEEISIFVQRQAKYKAWARWLIIGDVFAFAIICLFIVGGLVGLGENEALCAQYATLPISEVPANCYSYFAGG